jgi:hypothetical protein
MRPSTRRRLRNWLSPVAYLAAVCLFVLAAQQIIYWAYATGYLMTKSMQDDTDYWQKAKNPIPGRTDRRYQ